MNSSSIILIGHRGFRQGVAENSIKAFELARSLKLDYCEFDVHLSADGVLFILHDETLDRTTTGTDAIEKLQSKTLDTIQLKNSNEYLPRLDTVLKHFFEPNQGQLGSSVMKFMIELKGKGTGKPTAECIVRLSKTDNVVFSGRDIAELKNAHDIAPAVPLCLNITSCKTFTPKMLLHLSTKDELPLPFTMISLDVKDADQKYIKKCWELGIRPLVWNFLKVRNPVSKMRDLFHWGIGGMLLDSVENVEEIKKILKKD